MKDSELIRLAVGIAIEAHADHVDKAGLPYIGHVMRVMNKMKGLDAVVAAVLHDVVEDSDISFVELASRGIPVNIVDIVRALSRVKGESYEDFIVRAGNHPIARRIKIADLEDNMDLKRLPSVSEKDLARLNKYIRAHDYLVRLL